MKYRFGKGVLAMTFLMLLLFFLLALVEACLIIAGNSPCEINPTKGIEIPDEYIIYETFLADEDGITRFSENAAKWIAEDIENVRNRSKYENKLGGFANELVADYIRCLKRNVDNEFCQMIKRLLEKEPALLTPAERAYLDYCRQPVNAQGFRSITFSKNYPTDKKKVLLLGDSFTYGSIDDGSITSSFADVLATKDYLVFNSGISSTDPPQYEAVAKKYIPFLEPDVVVVNFFIGNDRMIYHREVKPFQPVFYQTNAGQINAFVHGQYIPNPQTAFEMARANFEITERNRWFNSFCSKTVLGTRLWVALWKAGLASNKYLDMTRDYERRGQKLVSPTLISESYIESIKNICEENGAQFILTVIPELPNLGKDISETYPGAFERLKFHFPDFLTEDHFQEDWHFNVTGHRLYADFLDSLIQGN